MGSAEKFLGGIGLAVHKGFVLERDIDAGKIDHASIHNILVVLRHQMGDMLAATPMMRSLKSIYPASKLILVTKRSSRYTEIFTGENSIADEVFIYEKGFENFVNLVKELREKKIDLAVIPSTVVFSSTNHLIAHYSEARIRAGVKSMDHEENRTAYVLNVKKDFNWAAKKVHQIERNLDIIRQLGINPLQNNISIILNKEYVDFAERYYAENNIERSKPVISFHPGAAKAGNTWPAEKFAELAYLFVSRYDAQVFISEGPADKKYADEMAGMLKEKYNIERIFRHKGDLMNNIALISLSDLFVTNDTGVMHLASGLELPVIALFGPTKAWEWGPLGKNKISIQASSPNLANIEVKKVFDECQKALSLKKPLKFT